MRYRKRPVVIEAVRWFGGNTREILSFCGGDAYEKNGALCIDTLEGTFQASVGDYIIKGVNGEVYPCKPDIFAATYEAEKRRTADTIQTVEEILKRGNDAEIRRRGDGVVVLEVQKKIKYNSNEHSPGGSGGHSPGELTIYREY